MAEKLRDGIGRELRYMEYKFRKKRSDQHKDKKKTKQNQYGKNYPSMEQFSSSNLSPDMAEAVPSNTGEEDLQLQVALAMSKEEASEQNREEQSDKIRLELALKESAQVADATVAKMQSKPAVNGTADPWGQPPQPQSNVGLFGAPASKGFESNAWEAPSVNGNSSLFDAPPQPTAPAANTWGGTSTGILPPPQKSPVRQSMPWGVTAPAPQVTQPSQPPVDPWGSSAPLTTPQANPWDSKPPPPTQPDPWANISTPAPAPASKPELDPWGSSAPQTAPNPWDSTPNPPTTTSNAFQPPTSSFDPPQSNPLEDFSTLNVQEPSAKPLTASDLLTIGIMTPQAPGMKPQTTDVNDNQVNGDTAAAGNFLGTKASLINMDNLVTKSPTTNPYMMSTPTSGSFGAARNPFNQKGPSLSLNQLKVEKGSEFGVGAAPAPKAINPTPFSLPATGYPMAPATQQSTYGVPGMMPTPNPYMQQAAMANYQQQPNQSLF
nr:epsin-1 [Ciona intestinalis]|eukprot:XP_002124455.1 epsin-1 [Ciona intestinalis]